MDVPGEKVLVRLIDAIENGIGGLVKPWQIRRTSAANAEARAREMEVLAEAENEVADIRAGRKRLTDGKLLPVERPPLLLEGPAAQGSNPETAKEIRSEIVQAASDTATAENLQESINLKKATLHAEAEAEKIDERNEKFAFSGAEAEPLDEDWFAHWRSGAKKVRREEMQQLWGKLLAGEVADPGSHSLHTIEFLSRMSAADAQLLERLAPFVTRGGLFKPSEDYFQNLGFGFDELLYLDSLGILGGLTGIGGLSYSLNVEKNGNVPVATLTAHKKVVVFEFPDDVKIPDKKLEFQIYSVSKVGQEIFGLGDFSPNTDHLRAICREAFKQGCKTAHLGDLHPNRRNIMNIRPFLVPPKDSAGS